jgi:hypothetical protein
MICVVIFGACFFIYGVMSLVSGRSMSPENLLSRKTHPQENLMGKKARIAGGIYVAVGVAIMLAGYIFLK